MLGAIHGRVARGSELCQYSVECSTVMPDRASFSTRVSPKWFGEAPVCSPTKIAGELRSMSTARFIAAESVRRPTRRWERDGLVESKRTVGGQRRYEEAEILSRVNSPPPPRKKRAEPKRSPSPPPETVEEGESFVRCPSPTVPTWEQRVREEEAGLEVTKLRHERAALERARKRRACGTGARYVRETASVSGTRTRTKKNCGGRVRGTRSSRKAARL